MFVEFVLDYATKSNHPIAKGETAIFNSGKGHVLNTQPSSVSELYDMQHEATDIGTTCLSTLPSA